MDKQSFWGRKEGLTGMLLMGGLAAGGLFLLSTFGLFLAPIITAILSNLFFMGVSAVALGGLVYILIQPNIRSMLWNIFKGVSRGITNIFVDVYHIDIMKNRVAEMYEKVRFIISKKESLQKSLANLRRVIKSTEREYESTKESLQAASKGQRQSEIFVHSRQLGRLEKSLKKQKEGEKKLLFYNKMLEKYVEVTQAFALDTENEVKAVIRDYELTKEVQGAMQAVKTVLLGDKHKEMYNQALEVTLEKTLAAEGEIDSIIDMTSHIVDNFDAENAQFEKKAMEMLEVWTQKEESVLLGDGKKLLIDEAKGLSIVDEVAQEVPQTQQVKAAQASSASQSGFGSLYK